MKAWTRNALVGVLVACLAVLLACAVGNLSFRAVYLAAGFYWILPFLELAVRAVRRWRRERKFRPFAEAIRRAARSSAEERRADFDNLEEPGTLRGLGELWIDGGRPERIRIGGGR